MNIKLLVSAALMAALAACATPQHPQVPQVTPVVGPAGIDGMPADGQVYPGGNPFRLLAVEELPIVGVTVDSASSGLTASRLIDGDLSTQWVNGGYRNATSWAAVELAEAATLGSIAIKTGPSPAGTSYDVQVSADGTAWTTVLANQTNTGWGLETKALPAGTTGRFVRIFWRNSTSNPQAHFAIFELVVNGETTAGPTPTPVATPTPTPSPSATPTATPTPTPTLPPTGTPTQVSPTGITASSTYSNLVPQRAIDGNATTQWANGGYREASAWLNLAFENTQAFSSLQIKTGALPAGVGYVVEVSQDGTTWTAASGTLTNTTWNMETKALSGQGKFLRIRFTNSASNPIARFSVYEVAVFAASATSNQAPTIAGLSQAPMKINLGTTGTLQATASDPEGGALTYSWSAKYGQITGSGAQVSYTIEGDWGPYGPENLGEEVTLTVRDPQGATATRTFPVDLFSGQTFPFNADQTFEWDPAQVQTAQLFGDVTVQAGGDFSTYNAVICEYNTTSGRKMALIPPGTTTIPGVNGYMYMYMLKMANGEFEYYEIADPTITLTLQAGATSVVRTIGPEHVLPLPDSVGLELREPLGRGGSPTPWHLAGESTAMNGSRPYETLLGMQVTPYLHDDGKFHVIYSLNKLGDRLPARGDGSDPSRILFTDSLGGTSDNRGAWTIYELYYD